MCREPTLDPGDWYPEDESPGDARLGLWLLEPECLGALLWTLGIPVEVVLTMLDLRIFKTRQRGEKKGVMEGKKIIIFHFYRSVS